MSEWKDITLGDVLKYEQPYKYAVESTQYHKSGIPVLTAGKSFILGYTSESENVYSNLPVIIFDDFTSDSKYVDFPFKVKSSAMKFLREKNENEINLKYFYEVLQTLKIETTGGEHKRRWISEYSKIKIKTPDYNEQTRIAEILSTADEAIAQTESLIVKYQRIKTGLMQDLLTKGIDENGNIRSKETHKFKSTGFRKYYVPIEWESNSFNSITKCKQGLQIPIDKRFKEEGINRLPYITVQAINTNFKNPEFIFGANSGVICNSNDILFTRTGNTGEIITGINGVFHNNFFRLDFDRDKIDKDYLIYFLKWQPIQNLIKDLAGLTTIPDLKHKDFLSIPIFFPKDKKEQMRIVEKLNHISKFINEQIENLFKLKSIKMGLMQDLLSGNVRLNMDNKN